MNLYNMFKKPRQRTRQAVVLAVLLSLFSTPSTADDWDTYPDTWVAVDGLGR